MIRHVCRRAGLIPEVAGVYVATDHEGIFEAVREFGGTALMTSPDHRSGSDRLAEAADIIGLEKNDIVINVQGDQPCLNPLHPSLMARALIEDENVPVATLAVPLTEPAEIRSPNHVKVVFDQSCRALYFSRSAIPFYREGTGEYFKHIGLYAYRAGFLREYVAWPPGKLESAEKLEQLRILERSIGIKVVIGQGLSPEVDVPEDLAVAEAVLKQKTFI
jgi:3-deoxy-manno-octulosonate cytidylyltransferase (CMP-KDO synthetase)